MSIASLTPEIANSLVRLANMGDTMAVLRQKLSFSHDKGETGSLLDAVQNLERKITVENTQAEQELNEALDPNSQKNKAATLEMVVKMREEKARQEAEDRKVLFGDDKPLNETTIKNAERFLAGNHKMTWEECDRITKKCCDAVENKVPGFENCPHVRDQKSYGDLQKHIHKNHPETKNDHRAFCKEVKNETGVIIDVNGPTPDQCTKAGRCHRENEQKRHRSHREEASLDGDNLQNNSQNQLNSHNHRTTGHTR